MSLHWIPDTLAVLALGVLVVPFLSSVHRAGHAFLAALLDLPPRASRPRTGRGDVGAHVKWEIGTASPAELLAVSLAGPAANLAAAALTCWLAAELHAYRPLSLALAAATGAGLVAVARDLAGRGDEDDPWTWSDGRWARVALRALRERRPGPVVEVPAADPRREPVAT